jgi:hypothetical protein
MDAGENVLRRKVRLGGVHRMHSCMVLTASIFCSAGIRCSDDCFMKEEYLNFDLVS